MNDNEKREIDAEGRLLAEQLGLLEAKQGEVEALLASGGRADEGLVDDLVGIVLVVRAALLAGEPSKPNRGELEDHERTARGLLQAVLRRQRAANHR